MGIWKGWFETVPCRAALAAPFPALCPRILGPRFTNYGLRMFWGELMVIWKRWFETVPFRATLNTPFSALCPRILRTRFGAAAPPEYCGKRPPEQWELWEGKSLKPYHFNRTLGAQRASSQYCQSNASKQRALWEQNRLEPYPCNRTLGSTEVYKLRFASLRYQFTIELCICIMAIIRTLHAEEHQYRTGNFIQKELPICICICKRKTILFEIILRQIPNAFTSVTVMAHNSWQFLIGITSCNCILVKTKQETVAEPWNCKCNPYPKGPDLEQKTISLENFILAWKFLYWPSELPTKKQGLRGWLAQTFQSHLKIPDEILIFSIFGPFLKGH